MGDLGEKLAAGYLKKRGYSVLKHNYRSKLGEIDLIAQKAKTICFVEVKTRTKDDFGPPQAAVNQAKQRQLTKAAMAYLKAHGLLEYNCRFDVISILMGNDNNPENINFIENAFSPGDYYSF